LRQVANAEVASHVDAGGLHLVVANGLVQKGFGILVNQPFAHDHAGGLADVGGDPAAAQFFGDGGGGAGAAVEVCDEAVFRAGGADDTVEKGFGFLGVGACPNFCVNGSDIS
jgi:hypothetical protein